MREQGYLDDLSVRAAVAGWRSGEAAFSAEFRSPNVLTPRLLDRWLAYWGVADRLRRSQREQVLTFLDGVARPALLDVRMPSPEAYALLDEINFQAVKARITTASLMMLLSRFACSCEPTVYAPVTQHSRRGIQIVGHALPDMSYRTYMLAFMKARARFADSVADAVLAHGSLGTDRPVIPLDVLAMRALDRRLMLAGGFPPERFEAMLARAPAAAETRPAGVRSVSAEPSSRRLHPDSTPG